eukprot:3440885-Pleurochrysis_carterae.AAC.1
MQSRSLPRANRRWHGRCASSARRVTRSRRSRACSTPLPACTLRADSTYSRLSPALTQDIVMKMNVVTYKHKAKKLLLHTCMEESQSPLGPVFHRIHSPNVTPREKELAKSLPRSHNVKHLFGMIAKTRADKDL